MSDIKKILYDIIDKAIENGNNNELIMLDDDQYNEYNDQIKRITNLYKLKLISEQINLLREYRIESENYDIALQTILQQFAEYVIESHNRQV